MQFGISATAKGWISIGWSADGTMNNQDLMMCYVNAAGTGFLND
jgi:hypothetical protein